MRQGGAFKYAAKMPLSKIHDQGAISVKLHSPSQISPGAAISTITTSSLHNKASFSESSLDQAEAKTARSAMDSSSRDTTLTLSLAAQDAIKSQVKRMNDMQDALAKLSAMPSANASAKQAASERVAMLKMLLDTMKQMMIGATPAQAKAMATQLKGIAQELASMGKMLSSGESSATAGMVSATVETENSGTDNTASSVASGQAAVSPATTEVEAKAAADDTGGSTAGHNQQAVTAYAAQHPQDAASNNGTEKAANDALKKALGEAIKALRAVISMVKSKVGTTNKDIKAAESKLAELGRAMDSAENQNSGGLAVATDTVSASVDTTGGTYPAISVGDAGGAVGSNISVSV